MSTLPFRTDFDQLKNQARDLLQKARAGDPEAFNQISAVSAKMTLASAQLAIARSYGFASWSQLKAEAQRKEIEKAYAGWQRTAVFGSWFDEEAMTDRQTEHHEGSCRQCGARYAFATKTVRGFADYVEANCSKCGASLGEFREDVDVTIEVQLLNAHD